MTSAISGVPGWLGTSKGKRKGKIQTCVKMWGGFRVEEGFQQTFGEFDTSTAVQELFRELFSRFVKYPSNSVLTGLPSAWPHCVQEHEMVTPFWSRWMSSYKTKYRNAFIFLVASLHRSIH